VGARERDGSSRLSRAAQPRGGSGSRSRDVYDRAEPKRGPT
jgi:hypothetical protein